MGRPRRRAAADRAAIAGVRPGARAAGRARAHPDPLRGRSELPELRRVHREGPGVHLALDARCRRRQGAALPAEARTSRRARRRHAGGVATGLRCGGRERVAHHHGPGLRGRGPDPWPSHCLRRLHLHLHLHPSNPRRRVRHRHRASRRSGAWPSRSTRGRSSPRPSCQGACRSCRRRSRWSRSSLAVTTAPFARAGCAPRSRSV